MTKHHPDLIPDTLHGVSILETGDKKFFIAVYAKYESEDEQEYLVGHFALSIFAKTLAEAEETAKIAETDETELVLLFDVKDTLKQAIEQDGKDQDKKGKWN